MAWSLLFMKSILVERNNKKCVLMTNAHIENVLNLVQTTILNMKLTVIGKHFWMDITRGSRRDRGMLCIFRYLKGENHG